MMETIKTKENERIYELNCLFGLKEAEKISEISKNISDWANKSDSKLIEVSKVAEEGKVSDKGFFWVERKRFFYPVKKNKAGFYFYAWFSSKPSALRDLERMLKLENSVIRFMITKTDSKNVKVLNEVKEIGKMGDSDGFEKKEHYQKEEKEEKTEDARLKITEEIEKPALEVTDKPEVAVILDKVEEEGKALVERVKEVVPEVTKEKEEIEKEKGREKVEKKGKELKEEPEVNEEELKASRDDMKDKTLGKDKVSEPEEEKTKEKPEKEKSEKRKKISLDELDKKLDDILNQDIL